MYRYTNDASLKYEGLSLAVQPLRFQRNLMC